MLLNSQPIKNILSKLHEITFRQLPQFNTYIFLVGKSTKSHGASMRDNLRRHLAPRAFFVGYDIYYPEDMFDELLQGKVKFNLLELENMLADSVHAVVLILESPGAIAELGAFVNNNKYSDKLVVVVDEKYRKANSFISKGLINYLIKHTASRIIYHDFASPNYQMLAAHVRKGVSHIRKHTDVNDSISNPISLQHYILAGLFIFGELSKETLNVTIKILHEINATEQNIITTDFIYKLRSTSIGILLKKREVELRDRKYTLTKAGIERLFFTIGLSRNSSKIKKEFDLMRIDVLNLERETKIFAKC